MNESQQGEAISFLHKKICKHQYCATPIKKNTKGS